MTKEEVIAAIKKSTEELGHVPSARELLTDAKFSINMIRKHFGCYKKALTACGLERRGCGYQVELKALAEDWAKVVRELEKVPTISEYDLHGKYSHRPLVRHFGSWNHVPEGLLEYARKEGLEDNWKDVLEVLMRHFKFAPMRLRTPATTSERRLKARVLPDEPVYGPPMVWAPLTYAPTNEAGVLFLFGTVARDLGFAVTRVQTGFPDLEAMREVEPERWQRVRIEVEYESRNFLTHTHPPNKCDLIVCWNHNWEECPLEVVELKSIGRSGDRDIG
jgi:hypothetical protein